MTFNARCPQCHKQLTAAAVMGGVCHRCGEMLPANMHESATLSDSTVERSGSPAGS